MKRNSNGELIFKVTGKGPGFKVYYGKNRMWEIQWHTEQLCFYTDKDNEIIAERFLDGPYYYSYLDENKEDFHYYDDNMHLLSSERYKWITSLELKCNCFGYVFLDSMAWLDDKKLIDSILLDDSFEKNEKAKKNSIVIFSDDIHHRHIAKFLINKKSWISKMGVYAEKEAAYKEHKKEYKKKQFYIRTVSA